jgi:hypothetical protein
MMARMIAHKPAETREEAITNKAAPLATTGHEATPAGLKIVY